MKEQFGLFLETNKLHMKNFLSILRRTLMEQRLSKILCSVFKLVNNKTNPKSLNELISLGETTYALRGKDISLRSTQHALDSIPSGIRRPRSGTTCLYRNRVVLF